MELDYGFMARVLPLALAGLPVTVGLSALTLALAIPLAFLFSLLRVYRFRGLSQAVSVYVSFARGTPMVLQILIVYSLLPSLANAAVRALGLELDVFGLNPLWYAVAVFSFNTTAILTEVFRSALLTVDRGQLEAALSVGMSSAQAYRRVVIPQAFLVALPNVCNATINLIKGTSLAFLMTVRDITAIAKIEASYGYHYIESYLIIFALYLAVCGVTQFAFERLERRLGIYRAPAVSF